MTWIREDTTCTIIVFLLSSFLFSLISVDLTHGSIGPIEEVLLSSVPAYSSIKIVIKYPSLRLVHSFLDIIFHFSHASNIAQSCRNWLHELNDRCISFSDSSSSRCIVTDIILHSRQVLKPILFISFNRFGKLNFFTNRFWDHDGWPVSSFSYPHVSISF